MSAPMTSERLTEIKAERLSACRCPICEAERELLGEVDRLRAEVRELRATALYTRLVAAEAEVERLRHPYRIVRRGSVNP